MHIKKALLIFAAALMILPLSGCLQSAEDLYALPRQSDEYYTLQNQIEAVLDTGAEYSAPVAGDRRQAVQLADLDSDGQKEAIVFLRTQGEKPLKIYIYKKTEAGYEEYAVIEGDGSAFASVDFRQIDTALGLELVVGRQVSDQLPQTLSVYTMDGGQASELLSVSCIRHTLADLNGNGLEDLLVFRTDEDAGVGLTEYYSWTGTGLELVGSADMSAALTPESIRRVIGGMMQQNTPAVFVASAYEESTIVTDVFVLSDGVFTNVSSLGDNPDDLSRIRHRGLYAADVDGDGLIELPRAVALPKLGGDEAPAYNKIQWYNLRTDGSRRYKLTTFHNHTDGWFVELLPDWEESLAVDYVRDPQQLPCYRFFRAGAGTPAERFVIYAFTGADAAELARSDGRFPLGEKGDVFYAEQIYDDSITRAQLEQAFHFISTDWNSGEV